ncbi:hypothetical protein C7T35_26965 [Variovorax sp. WS11]|uniref:hypothetical protein n=1 Tax=Variovorax sp. WS11 TaxID=1105204 RepID=UPI000D0D8F06|nr:hypothetical protein [Variovorax sp. WS11]NDZ14433.1 hypothetical protein [Variovorax sp. WS11]PSL81526.1 hypothetical protein C7T35_26965 [Variovorax sp. WS11]
MAATPDQFQYYMPFLCSQKPFVELDLSCCRIGVSNFNKLVDALSKKQPPLMALSLSCCGLGANLDYNKGVHIEILPVAEMGDLRELDLSGNELRVKTTVVLLAKLREKKSRLQSLNLSANPTGPEKLVALAALLKDSETLLRVSFEPTKIQDYTRYNDGVLTALTEAVEHNKYLQQLDIRQTHFPDPYHERMIKALDRNRKLLIAAAMRSGMYAVVVNRHDLRLPYELADVVFDQGLTPHDALSLSVVNKQAWNMRERLSNESLAMIDMKARRNSLLPPTARACSRQLREANGALGADSFAGAAML